MDLAKSDSEMQRLESCRPSQAVGFPSVVIRSAPEALTVRKVEATVTVCTRNSDSDVVVVQFTRRST